MFGLRVMCQRITKHSHIRSLFAAPWCGDSNRGSAAYRVLAFWRSRLFGRVRAFRWRRCIVSPTKSWHVKVSFLRKVRCSLVSVSRCPAEDCARKWNPRIVAVVFVCRRACFRPFALHRVLLSSSLVGFLARPTSRVVVKSFAPSSSPLFFAPPEGGGREAGGVGAPGAHAARN